MASLQDKIPQAEVPDFLVIVENGITTLHTPGKESKYIDVPEVWIERSCDGEFHLATGVGREIDYQLLKQMELDGLSDSERGRTIAMDYQLRGLDDSRYESIYAAAVMCLRQFGPLTYLPPDQRITPASSVLQKSNKAIDIIKTLVGKTGVWASAERHKYQNWTRDFALCTSWAFMNHPKLRDLDIVGKHLLGLARTQAFDGHIPIVFPDDEKALVQHMENNEAKTGKNMH